MRLIVLFCLACIGCSVGARYEPIETLGDGSLRSVTTVELVEEYAGNIERFTDVYVGKRFRVTGIVSSVGDGVVSLKDNGGHLSNLSNLASLEAGQRLTAECTFNSVTRAAELYFEFTSCRMM